MNTTVLKLTAVVCIAGCGSIASAASVTMRYDTYTRADGTTSGSNNAHVSLVSNGSYIAGHMVHTIQGDPAGGFRSFCIELGQHANGGFSTYQIVDLTSAPNPGLPGSYTASQAAAVVDIISRAISLGWINNSLQADTSQTDYGQRMAAIQGKVWEALGLGAASSSDTATFDTANTVQDYMNTLAGYSHANLVSINSVMTNRLRAAVADGEQDMLYVVPLPTSVWAGLGLLGGLAGVRVARRR